MGIARNIARLVPNGSGLLPNANIEAVATSKLTGTIAENQLAAGIKKVFAVKTSVTGQAETRAGAQNGTFLNSTSSYVAGLTAITHAATSSNNYLIIKFKANWKGNATSDCVQVVLFKDGAVLQGGACGHGNNSSGSGAREIESDFTAILKPTDTNSHSYMVGWASTEGGASETINQSEDPNYSTQCTFELWEVSLDQANASGNSLNAYYFS